MNGKCHNMMYCLFHKQTYDNNHGQKKVVTAGNSTKREG
jgi:hypothetical protein